MTEHLDSNREVTLNTPIHHMATVGWIASTQTNEGQVTFGLFDTSKEALDWALQMTGFPLVYPVYKPQWNQG